MGMFDYIDTEYDLPLPPSISDEQKNAIRDSFRKDQLQTKDLDCIMSYYFIDKDGYFYVKVFDEGRWGISDASFYRIKKEYIHQHLRCYNTITVPGEKFHFWLEYDIKFTDGRIQEAKLTEWKQSTIPVWEYTAVPAGGEE